MQINQESNMSITVQNKLRQSYEGFHSERSPTQHRNILDDQNQMSIQCSIYHPIQEILKALRLALREKNYKGVEVFDGSMFIVRMGWRDRLKKVLFFKQPPKYMIRLQTRQYASIRILTLKNLTNPRDEQEMKYILQILQDAMPTPPPPHEDQYKQDIYSLDATATYMFHKILLNEKYSIGKKMHQLLKHSQEYSNSKQIIQPPPLTIIQNLESDKLDWINNVLHEIGNDMLQGFNCSKKELIQILGFCRKTVEEYYYNHLIQKQANQISMLKFQENKSLELLPMTQAEFMKLQYCYSGPSILRQLFFINHLFTFQTTKMQIKEDDKKEASKKLEYKYENVLKQKIKKLKSTQYRDQYQQYLSQWH